MSLVTSVAEFAAVAREVMALPSDELVAVDTETTGVKLFNGDVLRGVSLAWRDSSAYVALSHPDSWNLPEKYWPAFRELLQNMWALPLLWNAKFDMHSLQQGLGVEPWERYVDVMALYWLLDENEPKALKKAGARLFGTDADAEQRALKALMKGETQADCYKRLRDELRERGEREPAADTKERAKALVSGSKRGWADLTAAEIADYAEQDTVLTRRIYEWVLAQDEYQRIEPAVDMHHRLIRVVQRMERRGVGVDLDKVKAGRERCELRMAEIEDQFRRGGPFDHGRDDSDGTNLSSPSQLARLIYEDWGLPVHERTDSGAPSTSRAALEENEGHSGIDLILEHRRLGKAKSAYFDSLLERADPEGRVHASFNTTGTVTGRLSCNEPNLMTIPREGPLSAVRECFVPAEGYELWSFDLSQAELRFAAALSRDAALRAAIEAGDVYQATADSIFCTSSCPRDEKGKCSTHRPTAKALVLAYPYGVRARKFARMMLRGTGRLPRECPAWTHPKERETWSCTACSTATRTVKHRKCEECDACGAQVILDDFEGRYVNLSSTMKRLAQHAEKTGRLPLLHPGRFRRFRSPALEWPVPPYTALNSADQGGVAGLMTDVMVCSEPATNRLGARLVLQVHDSLVYELVPGTAEKVHRVLQSAVDAANPLDIRLPIEAKPGV